VVLSLPFGPAAAGAHLLALGSAWAYDLGVKGTALSVLPYVVSFGLLPVFITLAAADRFPPAWLAAAAALLGAGAHFANAQPDLADDRATGVRGLPHRLGTTGALVAAAALVLAATGVLLTAPEVRWQLLPVSAGVVGTGFLLSRRPGSRAAFRAIVSCWWPCSTSRCC
jgi:4-hydroxybenzoate polyprenyltransferase